MFTHRITLFRIFGFEVRLDASWLLLGVLIAWSLAEGWFKQQHPDLGAPTRWLFGAIGAVGLLFSIVFHELSHSLVARRHGIQIKGITLFLFGGVAEMEEEPKDPRGEFRMAIVGPFSSLLLAIVFGAGWWLGAREAWPPAAVSLLSYLAVINGLLAGFNLIPAFPLDGGRVLRAVLWQLRGDLRWATRVASRMGTGFGTFLIILGVVSVLGGNFVGGMWQFLIGMFLRAAARMPYRQLLAREALAGEAVRRFMVADPITVPRGIPVAELVEEYIYRHQLKTFPVVDEGRLVGCVSLENVKALPRDRWRSHAVGEITQSCGADNTIGADDEAVDALAKMTKSGVTRLLVVEGDRLVGILSLRDLLGFLALKVELEGG